MILRCDDGGVRFAPTQTNGNFEETIMKKLLAITAMLTLSLGGGVFAQEEQAAATGPTSPWSGKVGLGYLATSGNAENTAVNANVDLNWDKDKWHHSLIAVALGTVAEDVTTAERYQLNYKAQYDLTEFNYIFGLLGWEKDRFSGVAEQTIQTIGYGRRILNNASHVLNAEISRSVLSRWILLTARTTAVPRFGVLWITPGRSRKRRISPRRWRWKMGPTTPTLSQSVP